MNAERLILEPIQEGYFIERTNRFLVRCRVGAEVIEAHLPNRGRLWEESTMKALGA